MGKRRKRIISGQLVEEIIYTAPEPRDNSRTRAEKSRITSEAQKRLNRRHSRQSCERAIAANFQRNDLFVTLTFDEKHSPARREEVKTAIKQFLRLLRTVRRKRGKILKYLYTIEGKHGAARLHVHMLINATGAHDNEDIKSLWRYGTNIDIKRLDVAGAELNQNEDKPERWHGAIAGYFTKEQKPVGARAWVCSLNLKKPVIETEFAKNSEKLNIPKEAEVIEKEEKENEWGSFQYVKYWLPHTPRRRKHRRRERRKRTKNKEE